MSYNKSRITAFNAITRRTVPGRFGANPAVGVVVVDIDPDQLNRYRVFIPGLYHSKEIAAAFGQDATNKATSFPQTFGSAFQLSSFVRKSASERVSALQKIASIIDIEALPWAHAQVHGSMQGGFVANYRAGDTVYIMFQGGDTQYPIITGSYFTGKQLDPTKAENAPPVASIPGAPPLWTTKPYQATFHDISKNPDKESVLACIHAAEAQLGIPQDHLAAVAWQESKFDNNARNVTEKTSTSSGEYSTSAFQVNSKAHPSFLYGGPVVTAGNVLLSPIVGFSQATAVSRSQDDWNQVTGHNADCAPLLQERFAAAGGTPGQEKPSIATNCAYTSIYAGCFLLANYKAALKEGYTDDAAWDRAFSKYNGTGAAADAYSRQVRGHLTYKPWKGSSVTVASNTTPTGVGQPGSTEPDQNAPLRGEGITTSAVNRLNDVFSRFSGFGTALGGAAGEGKSNRRAQHLEDPTVSAYTSPEGHRVVFSDGDDEERMTLQSIFGHRINLIDRPNKDCRIEVDTIGGHFMRFYDGAASSTTGSLPLSLDELSGFKDLLSDLSSFNGLESFALDFPTDAQGVAAFVSSNASSFASTLVPNVGNIAATASNFAAAVTSIGSQLAALPSSIVDGFTSALGSAATDLMGSASGALTGGLPSLAGFLGSLGSGSGPMIEISDPKGNHIVIETKTGRMIIETKNTVEVRSKIVDVRAKALFNVKAPLIVLDGRVLLGGPTASRPVSALGTIDTGGFADSINPLIRVFGR